MAVDYGARPDGGAAGDPGNGRAPGGEGVSEPKWTSGPWLLATSNSWRRFVDQDGRSVCEPILQADGHPDLHFGSRANAHLIAAAPDLYAELEDLIGLASAAMSQANGDGAEYDVDGELAGARAALAKARGEAG